jgi:hypothetical protein
MKRCKFKIGQNVIIVKEGKYSGLNAVIEEEDLDENIEYLVSTETGKRYYFRENELINK